MISIYNVKQVDMIVSYRKLWHLLLDKEMNKADLIRATGMSTSTMGNMVAGKNVSLEVLLRICEVLDCDFADIIEAKKESGKDNAKNL